MIQITKIKDVNALGKSWTLFNIFKTTCNISMIIATQ